MLTPSLHPPYPIAWGFTTKHEDPSLIPAARLTQVHGTRVVEASLQTEAADGLWTTHPGLRIGVRVADCVPVLLAGKAQDRPWIAAIHAGWRSAVGGEGTGDSPGILRVALGCYLQAGGRPEDLFWAFGPSIQKCHFEVGPEVIEAARKDEAWHEALAESGPSGKPHLDLHGFLRAQALHLGLLAHQEGSVPRCTMCERDLLYSYRSGDREARQWGWLEILEATAR